MANSYYTFPTPFVPGTKVRSDEVNVQFATLESAFDLLPTSPTAPARGVTFTGTESGSGNVYAVAMPNTRLSNQAGDRCIFRATHANTATISLNIDGLGPLTVVRADGTPVVAGDIVSGLYYEVVYDLVLNRYQLQVPTSVYLSDLDDRIDWATEWAVKAEDSAVSVAAGGDGSTTFSSLHWAAKSAASAASVSGEAAAAAASAAAALVSENNAAASESAADIDAIATAADRVQTGLDVVATAADRVQTGLDAVATASDAVDTAADLTQTDLDQISCAADAAAALASANSAAASYDDFDDRYLGSKASDPTLDNDSNALLTGALYWNTTGGQLKVYDGAAWQISSVSPATHYTKAEIDANTYTQTAADAAFAPITRPRENLLINGSMRVDQRGGGTTTVGVGTAQFTLDRWETFLNLSTGTHNVQRLQTSTPNTVPFDVHMEIDITAADTSIATTEYHVVVQAIEGYDVAHLMFGKSTAKSVTLSFYTAHTATGTYSGVLRNDVNTRAYAFEYTQSVADTWEKHEITIPGDTAGTWKYGGAIGLSLVLAFACGATYQTTAGSWVTGTYLGTANQVNAYASATNFCRLAAVKLEEGSEATDIEQIPYAEDLSNCKRFFERIQPGVVNSSIGAGYARSTTSAFAVIEYAEKRGLPAIAFSSQTDFRVTHGATPTYSTTTAVAATGRTYKSAQLTLTVASGLTAGQGIIASVLNTTSAADVDAEL